MLDIGYIFHDDILLSSKFGLDSQVVTVRLKQPRVSIAFFNLESSTSLRKIVM